VEDEAEKKCSVAWGWTHQRLLQVGVLVVAKQRLSHLDGEACELERVLLASLRDAGHHHVTVSNGFDLLQLINVSQLIAQAKR
jgi:hypothetical protein